MSFLDWFQDEKRLGDHTVDDLRREEGRLSIRESQLLSRMEELERNLEEAFRRGFALGSPVRRRIIARKYERMRKELAGAERELVRLAKEALAVAAIRFRLENRSRGEASPLRRMGAKEAERLRALAADDAVDDEEFAERLAEILGPAGKEGDPLAGPGEEARAVLEIWRKMDEGRIESVDEGLRAARAGSAGEREGEEE